MKRIGFKVLILIAFVCASSISCTTLRTIDKSELSDSIDIVGVKVVVTRLSGEVVPLIVERISDQQIYGQDADGENIGIYISDVQSLEHKKTSVAKTSGAIALSTLIVLLAWGLDHGAGLD
jgi:hypothetical protein